MLLKIEVDPAEIANTVNDDYPDAENADSVANWLFHNEDAVKAMVVDGVVDALLEVASDNADDEEDEETE